ncbi:chaperonin 10-like protein [Blakeslea trispora]|nr:chaperonin 10-like protein [Blakeslea trispora]
MRALELTRYGSPLECFAYNENVLKPSLQSPYQILIRVKAAGTNPVDTKIASGHFSLFPSLPNIMGADFAGIVEQKGDQVEGFEKGDAVFGSLHMPFSECGSYAEYTVVNILHDSIAKKPPHLSFEQAASAGIAVLTAYQGIVNHQPQTTCRQILVVGASGGVGAYAVQLAKALNNTVIGICSGKNVPFVQQMGADLVVDYMDQRAFDDFRQTYQGQLDLVFDCVGGNRYHELLDPLLNDQGLYSSAVIEANHALTKPSFARHPYAIVLSLPHQDFRTRIAPLFESGQLSGMVQDQENIIPLREGHKAHLKLVTHRTVGKIVLQI